MNPLENVPPMEDEEKTHKKVWKCIKIRNGTKKGIRI
jgi:hypothetical protein